MKLLLNYIVEGGNVFRLQDVKTQPIKKENIDNTVEYFKSVIKKVFPKVDFQFSYLGSTGQKPISGDIDLSFDINNVIHNNEFLYDRWGVDRNKFAELFNKYEKRAKTASRESLILKTALDLIASKFEDEVNDIAISKKSIGSGEIHFSVPQIGPTNEKLDIYAQVDLNVGKPEWLKFSYSSVLHASPTIKGLHKTQLIVHLFANKGYIFKHQAGVFNRATNKRVAHTPVEAIALLNKLYGFHLDETNIMSYKGIMNEIHTLPQDEQNKVFDIYLKTLDSTRCDIPEDLQAYWLANKERLGLKGNFLPDDSKLKGK